MHEQNDTERALGRLEGAIAAIHENTSCLPDLVKKVERHDSELRTIKWVAGAGFVAMIGNIGAWVKAHLGAH